MDTTIAFPVGCSPLKHSGHAAKIKTKGNETLSYINFKTTCGVSVLVMVCCYLNNHNDIEDEDEDSKQAGGRRMSLSPWL